ncbi:hypothetical protein SteCoe_9153 [Stentor coeruleus]|uniref:Uncharacterized protein n=1 Tax=Stentor coeruleus TaxID=5963 RepID=A0A1R2CIL5_9CILI|nr:hypothetical protein SteCoe_9153 [Stentor coeruleus]
MEENLVHGISGALSSTVATAFLHPFESLRTKMQAEVSSVYFIDYLKKVFKEEGLKGVYSGFSSNIVSIAISYAMYFFSYKYLRTMILRKKPNLSIVDEIYTSFISSVIVIVFNTPLWTINSRLMKDKSKSLREIFYQILYNEGPGAFFKGMSLSVLLTINPVIQYTFYEFLKKKLHAKSLIQYFFMGAVAKFIATVFTYPILTLRTRHQLNENENKSLVYEMMQILRCDLATNFQSFINLYNGFFSKAVQTVLNSAIILSLHEKITKALSDMLLKKPQVIVVN